MFDRSHNLRHILFVTAMTVFFLAPMAAQAEGWQDHLATWESLEHQRSTVITRLENLEEEHQKFVESIENLKEERARGEGSRRELENKLRENLRTVEALEEVQRRLQDIEVEQASLRRIIVAAIDVERDNLEDELRQVSTARRRELVVELNRLQDHRREYAAPLPEADQQRVDQTLEMARRVSNDHPRAMLSAADELEDTEDQLLAHVEALDGRIAQLERARSLYRRNQSFGEFDRFFDEDHRGRTVARFEEQASLSGDRSGGGQDRRSIFDEPERRSPQRSDEEPTLDMGAPAADESEEDYGAPEAEPDSAPDGFGEAEDGAAEDGAAEDEPEAAPEDDSFFDSDSETVVIERDIDPSDSQDVSYFNEHSIERDLQLLLHERDSLQQNAEELREKANELRRRANESR